MTDEVAVVGVTAWGLTLASLFATAGASVRLLARDADEAALVRRDRTAPARIASIRLPPTVIISEEPQDALQNVGIVVMGVPSQAIRPAARRILAALPQNAVVVSAAKGLERAGYRRMSEVLTEELPNGTQICALSGPNLADEIARGMPAATVVAGPPEATAHVQQALGSGRFRVYSHDDLVGVELGGALKNVLALGAGVCDGLGYGDNAKASIITRGLAEITRLGVALGARPATFAGLSGLGDIIATCASPLSRNHQVGAALGRGERLPEILANLSHVAEGVTTTAAAHALAQRHAVEMPIVAAIDLVLRDQITPAEGVRRLMERQPRGEMEAPSRGSGTG